MPDTFTAVYNLTKPEVNASRDVWGDKWNANIDQIDTLVNALNTSKLDKSGGAITGNITQGGSPLATQAYVLTQLRAVVPPGLVAAWSGSLAAIPAGWALCSGIGGTLNLMNKVIIGAGSSYAFGAVGGTTTHDHGDTGYHTLTTVEMPPHAHANSLSQTPHGHGYTDPGHYHLNYDPGSSFYGVGAGGFNVAPAASYIATSAAYTGITITPDNANISISNASAGSGGAHNHPIAVVNHLPPYLALGFIQKLAY